MAPITPASCTEFTTVKNDLQVQTVPIPLGKEALEIPFRLLNTLTTAEPPTLGQAVDMGVHRECRNPESLGHHNAGGFVAHPWQGFKGIKTVRHLTPWRSSNSSANRFTFLALVLANPN